ncbi:hypothetical protein LUW87_15295, partial [Rhabdothermincola sp. EGI L10124]
STAAKDTADDGAPRPNPTDENDGDDESDENRAAPGVCGYAQARLTLTARIPEGPAPVATPVDGGPADGSTHPGLTTGATEGPGRAADAASPGPGPGPGPDSDSGPGPGSGPGSGSSPEAGSPRIEPRNRLTGGPRRRRPPDLLGRAQDGTPIAVYVTAA